MAAPNIVNVSTITAKTKGVDLTTTTTTTLLSNSASSGKVFKINTIIVSNIDSTNSATVTMAYRDSGGSVFDLGRTIAVPPSSTLVLTDKNSVFYLEEGTEIRGGASAANDLQAIISYEEIS